MGKNDHEPPASDRQWWLSAGPETCFLCDAPVHPEVLTYCIRCDQGICMSCYRPTPGSDEVLCTECRCDAQDAS